MQAMSHGRRRAAVGVASFAAAAGLAAAAGVLGTVDGGGGRSAGGGYAVDASLCGAAGVSAAGPLLPVAARLGYVGQLTEVTGLCVTVSSAAVNEGDANQLGATAFLDDGTASALSGADIAWGSPAFPVGGVTAEGVASTLSVHADTTACVTGSHMAVSAAGAFVVLDSNQDNWGRYAGDGIPDRWQVRHFGPDSPRGMAGAIGSNGQDNVYNYTADLNPLDPASQLEIVAVASGSTDRRLCFGFTSTGRVYSIHYATNLVDLAWTPVDGEPPARGTAGRMWLSDTNLGAPRVYRVSVRVP